MFCENTKWKEYAAKSPSCWLDGLGGSGDRGLERVGLQVVDRETQQQRVAIARALAQQIRNPPQGRQLS